MLFKSKKSNRWEPYGEEKKKISNWIKAGFWGLFGGIVLSAYNWIAPEFTLLDEVWKMAVIGGSGIFLYLVWEFRRRLGLVAKSWAGKLLPILGYDTGSLEIMRLTLLQAEKEVGQLTTTVDKLRSAETKLHKAVEKLLRSKEKGAPVNSERILTISHRYKVVKKLREKVERQRDGLAQNVRALRAQREADKTAIEATREAEEALADLNLEQPELGSYQLKSAEDDLFYELTKSMAHIEETMDDMRDPLEDESGPSETDLDELVLVLKSEFGFNPADLEYDDEGRRNRRRNYE
ncbi:MAG: hypothetical protein AAF696_34005 [Bacteroidota bacterium]